LALKFTVLVAGLLGDAGIEADGPVIVFCGIIRSKFIARALEGFHGPS